MMLALEIGPYHVTPFAGVWIEITPPAHRTRAWSHSLRGSVD